MSERRHGRTEGLEQFDVFTGVGKVIFTTNNVRDLHSDVVDDIHEVKHRISIRTDNNKVFILETLHVTTDLIFDGRRSHFHLCDRLFAMLVVNFIALTEQLEPHGAVFLVSASSCFEFL